MMKNASILGYLTITLLMLTACNQPVPAGKIINEKASLPASLGADKMGVIASFINKRQHTMSTLYGNALSVKRARAGTVIQAGEELLLVTWKQKADDNWFGANIPAFVKRVEKVTTGRTPEEVTYEQYQGDALSLNSDTTGKSSLINAIFGMQASVMP